MNQDDTSPYLLGMHKEFFKKQMMGFRN